MTDGPKQESEAQISPDGKRIVYLKAVKDPRRNQLRNQVWVMRANGAKKKFLGWATGDYHVDEVSFSPDSKSLIVNQGDGGLGSNLIIDPLGRGKNREVRVEGPVWLTDADWQSR